MTASEDSADDQRALDAVVVDALDSAMISRKKRPTSAAIAPGRLLQKAHGVDIVKKASSRRGRCLLLFNCQIAPKPGGRLGELARMDTQTPVLYMEFPDGRLKLEGALVYPKNRYMVLKLGSGRGVGCEDIFEALIVFSKAYWVGMPEDNPEEKPLPLPASAHSDAKATFGEGVGAASKESKQRARTAAASASPSDSGDAQPRRGAMDKFVSRKSAIKRSEIDEGEPVPSSKRQKTAVRSMVDSDDSDASLGSEPGDAMADAADAAPTRRSRRSVPVVNMREASESDDMEGPEDGVDDSEASGGTPPDEQAANESPDMPAAKRKAGARKQAAAIVIDSDDAEEEAAAAPARVSAGRAQDVAAGERPNKSVKASKSSARHAVLDDDADEESQDGDAGAGSDEGAVDVDADAGAAPSGRTAARRRSAASKKSYKVDSSDEESASDGEDYNEGDDSSD